MAGMAAKMVKQYFETKETAPDVVDENTLHTGWDFGDGSIDIFFCFDENDAHVHLEGRNFVKVPEGKEDSLYKVMNELNDRYVHVKFVLDTESGQLCARDDDVIQLDSCGPECFELMIRMVDIVKDAYPLFMKALWA